MNKMGQEINLQKIEEDGENDEGGCHLRADCFGPLELSGKELIQYQHDFCFVDDTYRRCKILKKGGNC